MAKFVSKENLETLLGAVKTKLNTKITDPGNGTVGQILVKTDNGTEWATPEEVEQCMCIDLTEPELDEIMKGVEDLVGPYVDLGLPSGLLWATCNIGAEKPEEYGLYFQWGDTQGYNGACVSVDSTNSNKETHYFYWTKYKYCNGTDTSLTKYCTFASRGPVDGKTVLDLEDDAAQVLLDEGWRMPSASEFSELIKNTDPGEGANSYGWIENYKGTGISGYLRKSKINDNTIFFPDTGKGYRDVVMNNIANDVSVSYWTNLVYNNNSSMAQTASFTPNEAPNAYRPRDRYYGLPIRAVKPSK